MTTYHAKRLTGQHGDGWYIAKREGGVESIMPMFYHGDFEESRFEAEQLAHHLNERSEPNAGMFMRDNRSRDRRQA